MTTTAEQYNQAFRTFLDTLNPEQRQAVDQTEGPVLVLAGPGTGKTQVLAARIGNILLQPDTRPQNILCLTFTDAGVQAMRQRLVSLIGPTAHRIPIMTYHTFCNRVIQENITYFGQSNLETLSDVERIEVIRGMLDKLPVAHPLREGYKSPYANEQALRNLFAVMKSERWKPGEIQRAARQWLNNLSQYEEFVYKVNSKHGKKGDLKQNKVAEATKKMTLLHAAADLYPEYLRLLEKAGRYEYEDMILWTLAAFEKHAELLRNYQERYQYILVDEFQDTNGAQHALLQQLMNYWDTPNIFIVGDDDQSIYEFQGARLQNLLDFYQQYKKDLLAVVLTRNYRSLQPILDAAHRVIGQNTIRAAAQFEVPVSKTLTAYRQDNERLALQQIAYPNPLAEDSDIIRQIETLLQAGAEPDSIAVICAMHAQYKRLIGLLDRRRIPYQTKRPVNILTVPLIAHIRGILEYISDELREPFSGEHRLFALLHAPFFEIPAIELAQFALHLHKNEGTTWREALHHAPWPSARALVELVGTAADGTPLPLFNETLMTRLGVIHYALQHPDKTWILQVLSSWQEFIESGVNRDKKFHLRALLQLMATMDENKVELALQQNIQTGKGVQLLTAHGAKGLEFEYVFVPHCTKDHWEPSKNRNRHFAYPPTLVRSGEEDAMEARRRLFFVALTRAKTQLHISFSLKNEAGKGLEHARFLDETGLKTTELAVSAEQVLEHQAQLLGLPEQPVITLPDALVLAEYTRDFSLSAKGLNKYLRCPIAFYYEEILRVPSTSSSAALVGLAMHAALQHYFLEMQAHEKREYPPAERLAELFEKDMLRSQKRFDPTVFEQRLATGKATMLRYGIEQVPYWRKRSRVEFAIRQVELDGAVLNGAIDKIELLDNGHARIVDYKTGRPKKERVARPDDDNPLGGDYFRQLLFYKVLLEQSHIFSETVSNGIISWIEDDKKGNFRYDDLPFSNHDAQWMKTLILETWAKIQRHEFSTGCGKPDCAWCNMHRERQFFDVPEPEEVDLDEGG